MAAQDQCDSLNQHRMKQPQLLLLCFSVFLYAVCFLAQAPLLPYMISKLQADASYQYGLLMSSFSALQFVGALLSGPLADYYGGKSLLMVSFLASAVCYALTATATSVWWLFISRLSTLMQHAVLAARTIITASYPTSERAAVLGYIGASYGLGFAVGPAVGGWLSGFSLSAAAWSASAGSLVALMMVTMGLPGGPGHKSSSTKSAEADKAAAAAGGGSRLSMSSFMQVINCPGVAPLMLLQAGVGLAQSIFQSTFSLLMQQHFRVSSKTNGLVLSYVGLCIVIAQSLLIGPLTRRLGEVRAVCLCCGVMASTFACLSQSRELWQVMVWLLPLATAAAALGTINTARLTKAVPASQAGTIIAVDMSISSGLRTVSPLLGIWLYKQFGYSVVCWFMSGVMMAMFGVQLWRGRQQVDRRLDSRGDDGTDKKDL